jgi:hypothetical protein
VAASVPMATVPTCTVSVPAPIAVPVPAGVITVVTRPIVGVSAPIRPIITITAVTVVAPMASTPVAPMTPVTPMAPMAPVPPATMPGFDDAGSLCKNDIELCRRHRCIC